MNYRQAQLFIKSAILILALLIVGGIVRCVRSDAPVSAGNDSAPAAQSTSDAAPAGKLAERIDRNVALAISPKVGNLAKQFSDLNDAHTSAARAIGIKPIRHTADIMRLTREVELVESCPDFHIDHLTHSFPYLVPEAAGLLHEIGDDFNRKLASRGGGKYRIKVTSLLRTAASVGQLKRRNVNATENSAHLYGTTFDISYVKFQEDRFNTRKHTDGELKNLLAEVLLEFRDNGRCLVKYERKQGCFHITATGK